MRKCEYCGIEYTPKTKWQKYCCEAHQRLGYRGYQFIYTCLYCGEQYTTPNKDRNKYCSEEHHLAHRKQHAEQRKLERAIKIQKAREKTCPHCGVAFIRNRNNQCYCSQECMYQASLDKLNAANAATHVDKTYKCKECGKGFAPSYQDKRRSWCSIKCRQRYTSRVGKAIRRARLRGVKSERFDPREVFKRDGWRCQLCGVKTPKVLRGSLDDCAPELDHIIPIALGGSHTWDNVQCLCRKCNQQKGATIAGQLRFA